MGLFTLTQLEFLHILLCIGLFDSFIVITSFRQNCFFKKNQLLKLMQID